MNRLKELRKQKKVTQENLANETGVTKITVSRWERGGRIKSDKAKQLADYLNVSVGYLLGYSDIPDEIQLKSNEVIVDKDVFEKYQQAYNLLNELRGFFNEQT
ncbi:helix-turn-helix domain-containing protein [Streptococcus uberis]|uniref:helix-turn-helix domain-containing protein n=1 Tax=Streptococcus uberis TaxID=1349 RepID=UPI000E0025B2|nr:prophage Sa05, DNA-binding protein [Streptococcus uberis]